MTCQWSGCTRCVVVEVVDERAQQDRRWGVQNHADFLPGLEKHAHTKYMDEATSWKWENDRREAIADTDSVTWDGILLEEVFEALSEKDPVKMRAELIQVAAVAVAWVECLDRRKELG